MRVYQLLLLASILTIVGGAQAQRLPRPCSTKNCVSAFPPAAQKPVYRPVAGFKVGMGTANLWSRWN